MASAVADVAAMDLVEVNEMGRVGVVVVGVGLEMWSLG